MIMWHNTQFERQRLQSWPTLRMLVVLVMASATVLNVGDCAGGCKSVITSTNGTVDLSFIDISASISECSYEFPKQLHLVKVKIEFIGNADVDYGYINVHDGHRYGRSYAIKNLINKAEFYKLPLKLEIPIKQRSKDLEMKYKYLAGCDAQAEETGGTFTSPDYPQNYYNQARCELTLPTKAGYCGITVTFEDFAIEDSTGCQNDQMEIKRIAYCGESLKNKTMAFFVEYSNSITLYFDTNNEITGRGFKGRYSFIQSCDQVYDFNIKFKNGLLMSPSYPEHYSNNVFSSYEQYYPRSKIKLKFLTFDLEHSENCTSDALMIDEDKYCGTQLQDKTITLLAPFTLKFYSNGSGSYKGFLAAYYKDDSEVKQISDFYGSFESHGDGSYFANDVKYKYQFSAAAKYCGVNLYFPYFRLRKYLNCENEYVSILDRRYCGDQLNNQSVIVNHLPFDMIYEANVGDRGGFYVEYEYLTECVEKSDGLISSPSYLNYRGNTYRAYTFSLKNNYCGIQLIFDDFAFQYSPNCFADSLKINDIPYCGEDLKNKIVSYSLPTELIMTTDRYVNDRGFVFRYKYIKDCSALCNKYYYSVEDYITPSLVDGEGPRDDVYCSYVIHRYKQATYVKISFPLLNICKNNGYVKIDGKKYCEHPESEHPLTVISTFGKSDRVVIGWKKGFKSVDNATFTMVYTQLMSTDERTTTCNFESHSGEPEGIIQSPYYPVPYHKNLNCTYNFPENSEYCGLELNFSGFDLQSTPSCSADKLEIESVPYCGQQLLNTKVTKYLPLKLRFLSDNKINRNGFKASYRYLTDCEEICHRNFYESSGFITPHKGLSGKYKSVNCSYQIHRKNGAHSVAFILLKLDLCSQSQYILIDNKSYCSTVDGPPLKVISYFLANEKIKNVQFVNGNLSKPANTFIIKYEQIINDGSKIQENLCQPALNTSEGHLSNPNSDKLNNAMKACFYYIFPSGKSTKVTTFLTASLHSGNSLTVTQGDITSEVKEFKTSQQMEIQFPNFGKGLEPIIIKYSKSAADEDKFKIFILQNGSE